MTPQKSHSFKSDFVGRIDNIALSPSPNNSMVPLFEAITNAIQAIEDKFGKDNLTTGMIEVKVLRSHEGKPNGFVVRDNGVGFTDANLESFLTSDSRYKVARGGKGVGRFLWMKVFESVHIESFFDDGHRSRRISFDFVMADQDQVRNLEISDSENTPGTLVQLSPFRPEYAAHCPSKPSTIKNKIISHFLSYFINMHAPKIIVEDTDGREDIFDLFTRSVSSDQEFSFEVMQGQQTIKFQLHAFLLPKELSDDEKGNNALFYGAHSRTVERHELDRALGLKYIENDKVYFGYVESTYLNSIVNQERTNFSWSSDFFEEVHKKALEKTKEFLSEPIRRIRESQALTIEQVRNEHLRFLSIAQDPKKFAEGLPLYVQSNEDIFLELSRAALRQHNRKKSSFNDAKRKKLPDFDDKAREYTKELKRESVSSLAEYVMKRKLILDVFEDRLKFKNIEDQKFYFEEAVHEIICPLRESTDTLDYEHHNLWIIDDSLAFYTYFNSDKTIRAISGVSHQSTSEPDLAIFDLGLGFNHSGSNEPITIIEFKRPGRDDYTLQSNPIVQVRDYVQKLRTAHVARGVDGSVIREIEDHTPFMCFIIADIEASLLEMMSQFGPFHRRAGHGSYYKWDEGFKVFIEIMSYTEALRGAKARHQAFFEKLGVNP